MPSRSFYILVSRRKLINDEDLIFGMLRSFQSMFDRMAIAFDTRLGCLV